MHNRQLPKLIAGFCLLFAAMGGCTKLDTTTLGSDLIPAVDNINTFADTIDILSTQGFFPDSLVKIFKEGNQLLGTINNDPVFGKTQANLFLQLKPSSYPFTFLQAEDTLVGVDSVVLTLSYLGAYGDKSTDQVLEVSEVDDDFFRDSVYKNHPISYQPNTTGTVLATQSVNLASLGEYVKFAHGKDSARNQIRIKLADANMNAAFMNTLFNRDTAKDDALNNAFRNDSLFRRFYNGFAVKSVGTNSNSVMYISLTDATTRLEVHYRSKNGTIDSTYKSFVFNANTMGFNSPSSSANFIERDYTGTQVLSGSLTEHFLQTSPGTTVNLKLLGLDTIPNRIVHRASIIIEQTDDPSSTDTTFGVPPYLYLDVKDTSVGMATDKWKPLYFDLNPSTIYYPDFNGPVYFPSGGIDQYYFGGAPRSRAGGRKYYDINITRYVQQILTDNTPNYELRLYPAYTIRYPQYSEAYITYDNPPAFGRITIGSGDNPNPNYRMRMVMIYSNP